MEQEASKPELVPVIVVPVEPILVEEQFWAEVYNCNVREFVALLEDEFGVIGTLPQAWTEGREFSVGQPEWDMVLAAIRQLQEIVR